MIMAHYYQRPAQQLFTRGIYITASTTRCHNIVLMMGQRRRRWPIIKPILSICFVFAGWVKPSSVHSKNKVKKIHWRYVGLILGQCRRRWPTI